MSTPAPTSDPTSDPTPDRAWWLVALVALVAGLGLGPIDLWGQVVAPYPWANLCNAPSVWAAAAFLDGRWARTAPAAPVGAVVVLTVGVESYYLADVLVRDASVGNMWSSTALVWLAAGVMAGWTFGQAGAWASSRAGWRAVLGRAALPAVFGAEAVRNLVRLVSEPVGGRPDDLGAFAALLAALAIVALRALVRRLDRRTAAQVVGTALAASALVGGLAGAIA